MPESNESLINVRLNSWVSTFSENETSVRWNLCFLLMIRRFWLLQVETGKKTLILNGTKTSSVLNSLLTEIYHLKKDNSVKYSRKNDNVRPFESGGETSLEFFSLKTDCSLIVVCYKRTAVWCLVFSIFLIFCYVVRIWWFQNASSSCL